MPSSHSINILFVFVDYASKLSPTLKSFMFASARSDCPDFLFEILIEEEDYLNVNVDSISGIPRCVLSS